MRVQGDGALTRVAGGVVQGTRHGEALLWRGIPYAAPPVGALRFRAPQPVRPWAGIRDASRYGNVASQAYRGQFKGVGPGVPSGEDCLTVNVLSTVTARRDRRGLPVMVFIHGGGYSAGSSQDFAGQGVGFVDSGRVVYVSFNYRLGALGYLDFSRYSTRKRPIESNLGLRDQIAVLKWVHENIRSFGGDPHNVTVFGESAGGNAVTTLMATPSAAGLFARAIAQSAPANAVYDRDQAAEWAREYVAILSNETAGQFTDAAGLLTAVTAEHLVEAALTLQLRTPDAFAGMFCLAPVVDGVLLPERPIDRFRAGRAHRVPLIIGTNDREGSVFRGRVDILPKSPVRIRTVFERAPARSRPAMQRAYPGLPNVRTAADFGGDYAFWYPSTKVADFQSRIAAVHVYRFDIAPRLARVAGLDATHGMEMLALFDQGDARIARAMTALGGRTAFTQAGDRMRAYWLDFACTGTLPASWPAYTEPGRLTLVIDEVDHIDSDPRRDRRLAWGPFLPDV
ncbi:MAG: carboxylesterase/lipase family protein [Microbacteriaceae bacterium]